MPPDCQNRELHPPAAPLLHAPRQILSTFTRQDGRVGPSGRCSDNAPRSGNNQSLRASRKGISQ